MTIVQNFTDLAKMKGLKMAFRKNKNKTPTYTNNIETVSRERTEAEKQQLSFKYSNNIFLKGNQIMEQY